MLKERFKRTVEEVSKITGIEAHELKRDEYVRICSDLKIEGRLNKVELNSLGGYAELQKELFNAGPKILVLDIETAPLECYTWGIWNVNIPLVMIKHDWSILSWAAKWVGDDKVYYKDVRKNKDKRDDKELLEDIWKMLDECDVVLHQNGDKFDIPRLNTRFAKHKMGKPSSFKSIDTRKVVKKHFSLTSASQGYMTTFFETDEKKLKNSGFEMWRRCLNSDMSAFEEMEEYNIGDIRSLESLYFDVLAPWDDTIDVSVYYGDLEHRCICGSTSHAKNGFHYTKKAKYQKFKCDSCGAESRASENLLSKEKRKSLRTRE